MDENGNLYACDRGGGWQSVFLLGLCSRPWMLKSGAKHMPIRQFMCFFQLGLSENRVPPISNGLSSFPQGPIFGISRISASFSDTPKIINSMAYLSHSFPLYHQILLVNSLVCCWVETLEIDLICQVEPPNRPQCLCTSPHRRHGT